MSNETATSKTLSNRFWTFLMSWTGRVTAIVGLCASIAGGVTWLINHHRQQQERAAQLALARTQAAQGDYQASVETFAAILRAHPLDRTALDSQLDTAMLWTENFSVLVPEGQNGTELAGRAIDEMMPILESGLARSTGTRAADVQAHLGWAHWLNQHIAEREFGPAAEQNFRAALVTDPANVYANAMLGNWILQNAGDFSAAVQYLDAAASTGKARPFVRLLQIDGISGRYDQVGARTQLVKIANAMRAGGEPLDPSEKQQIFDLCFFVTTTDHAELTESLAAVPPHDAWLTYLWLEGSPPADSSASLQALTHDFIQANLLEISGQPAQALQQYRAIQQKLRALPGTTLGNAVDSAVERLSHS
jgi:tetratricopeptide (TPR) repeat protein